MIVDFRFKAMILAAGFGTRLRPYSEETPKPLFTIAGRPLLAAILQKLAEAGCEEAIVNTHHRAEAIHTFLSRHPAPFPVHISQEKEILGTGGAVRQVADFWDDRPFMLLNADIVFDFELAAIYRRHFASPALATLVLVKHPGLDSVAISSSGHVTAFLRGPDRVSAGGRPPDLYTFTGIHVIDPELLRYIPENGFNDIISAYETAMAHGHRIHAHVKPNGLWSDIGTPKRYRRTARDMAAPLAFESAAGHRPAPADIRYEPIAGDGSDRRWFRLRAGRTSLVLADHGIHPGDRPSEAAAFSDIGRHLAALGVPVPKIYFSDPFSGLVFLEDLGDVHLQAAARTAASAAELKKLYREVIDLLLLMATRGLRGFDSRWAYQGASYDRALIIEKECRYFVDAFLAGYLNRTIAYHTLSEEFEALAGATIRYAHTGLMHRDMQSRNILIHGGRPYFIDFQGARTGPVQYDLAALLIDPYAALPPAVQASLFDYAFLKLKSDAPLSRDTFQKGYACCCLTRNLQILGAFGFLTRIKQKPMFEQYIPAAMKSLKRHLATFDIVPLTRLKKVVQSF